MSADQRRAAIVAATVPLVREHGFAVSTRQIAEAAGVAEGTIFRVFTDKESLLNQAVAAALDTDAAERQLAAIDLHTDLRSRVEAAAVVLQKRMTEVIGLAAVIGRVNLPVDHDSQERQHRRVKALLSAVFEPDAGALRYSPADAAHRLQIIAFSASHPRLNDGRPLSPADIADLLLDGIRAHDAADPSP